MVKKKTEREIPLGATGDETAKRLMEEALDEVDPPINLTPELEEVLEEDLDMGEDEALDYLDETEIPEPPDPPDVITGVVSEPNDNAAIYVLGAILIVVLGVLVYAFRKPAIPVDVHVHRIANRLGWVVTTRPEETEERLMAITPRRHWILLNELLVRHGREICLPRRPRCTQCPVEGFCAKKGVEEAS